MLPKIYPSVLVLLVLLNCTNAGLWEWIVYGSDYKTTSEPKQVEDHSMGSNLGRLAKVPFEMRTADEKFLVEATKFGLQASDMDLCHHKVIMHLKKSCGALTEEDIGKLSVQLLNCQSSVEGRKTYKCTDEMTIGQCTKDMDANTWNAYHIVSNRARAVCYAARQQQFTAKTEMTVNKLVWTSENQVLALEKLEDGQNKVSQMTAKTLDTMVNGQKELAERQERLKASQQHIQTFVNGNLRELTREKALIAAGQRELAAMTEVIQKKLDVASQQLLLNENDRKINHQEILQDLALVQSKTKDMWIKIDNSTQKILSQHLETISHYHDTLQNLQRINSTVNYLLQLVDKTREEVDAKLGWLTGILGNTGDRIAIIYCCLIHGAYFVASAVTASFLHFPMFSRFAILFVVPLNALSDMKQQTCLDFASLTVFLGATVIFHWMLQSLKNSIPAPPQFLRVCYKIQNSFRLYTTRASKGIESATEQFKLQCQKRRSSMGFLPAKELTRFSNGMNASYTSKNDLEVVPENDVSEITESSDIDMSPSPGTSTPTMQNNPVLSYRPSLNTAKKDLLRDFDLPRSFTNDHGDREASPARSRRSSLSSAGRRVCCGRNKMGTPCKGSASVGSDYCYHHLHQD